MLNHKKRLASLTSLLLASAILICQSSYAEDTVQPFIDELKKDLPEKEQDRTGSFIESERRALEAQKKEEEEAEDQESYSEKLKRTEIPEREIDRGSYTEREKRKLAPEKRESAIQALKEGRSELKPRIDEKINHAFGLRYGVSLTRDITASEEMQGTVFSSMYGSTYAPDLSIFYEFQPFHSEWYGNIGFFGKLGFSFFQGYGQFSFPVPRPVGQSGTFPSGSPTRFQFFVIPATIGIDYRFNLLRFIRPYVMVGPNLIGYIENRNDDKPSKRGFSRGLDFTVGAAFLLNWLSSGGSWDMYLDNGIKKFYLTVDYSRLSTIGGDVRFTVQGVTLGFTFEY